MDLIPLENLQTAYFMYLRRLEFLRAETTRIVNRGLQLGREYEQETLAALDQIEDEVEGVDECIRLLNHLFRS